MKKTQLLRSSRKRHYSKEEETNRKPQEMGFLAYFFRLIIHKTLISFNPGARWYGEGGGRRIQDWEHVYTRGGFMLMYGKTNTVL